MKQDRVQLQAALFGDFATIQPNAETIRFFMEEFSDLQLIPSVIEMPETKSPTGITFRIGPDIRFLFRSEDDLWTVGFRNERIDVITRKGDPDSSDIPESSAFIERALAIFESIRSRINVDYSRLSYVTKHFLLEMEEEDLFGFFAKKFGHSEFYSQNRPRQWNFRISSRSSLKFRDDEEANVITQMSRKTIGVATKPEPQMIEGIESTFDINTAEEKKEVRFTLDNYKDFLSEASLLEEELEKDMLNAQ